MTALHDSRNRRHPQAPATYSVEPAPNNSMPIRMAAIGALDADATTATRPTAAPCAASSPSRCANAPPAIAPITNCGVTMPP